MQNIKEFLDKKNSEIAIWKKMQLYLIFFILLQKQRQNRTARNNSEENNCKIQTRNYEFITRKYKNINLKSEL